MKSHLFGTFFKITAKHIPKLYLSITTGRSWPSIKSLWWDITVVYRRFSNHAL